MSSSYNPVADTIEQIKKLERVLEQLGRWKCSENTEHSPQICEQCWESISCGNYRCKNHHICYCKCDW